MLSPAFTDALKTRGYYSLYDKHDKYSDDRRWRKVEYVVGMTLAIEVQVDEKEIIAQFETTNYVRKRTQPTSDDVSMVRGTLTMVDDYRRSYVGGVTVEDLAEWLLALDITMDLRASKMPDDPHSMRLLENPKRKTPADHARVDGA